MKVPVPLMRVVVVALITAFGVSLSAQTTGFKYQGSLTDSGDPANGTYEMQFKLFDAASGGNQIGTTLVDLPVTINNGIFSVLLDFQAAAFSGSNRWLEVSIRHNAKESYITLNPRELIVSTPYSVKTLSATGADIALDAEKLGGVNASEYVTNSTVGSSFIRNDTALQTASFNINGNGYFGGNVGIGTTSSTAKLTVTGGGGLNNLRVTDNNGLATAIDLNNTSAGGHPWRFQSVGSGVAGRVGNLEIWEASTALNPSIAIQPGGSVGIGTSFPVQRFQVDSGNMFIRGTNNFGNNGDRASAFFGDTNHYFSSVRGSGIRIGTFGVGDAVTLLEGSGNVGIGTTTPISKLQVVGNAIQDRASSGWVKAMIYIDDTRSIIRCYNSTLAGVAATTTPCGFSRRNEPTSASSDLVDFGFRVNDRFWSATADSFGTFAVVKAACAISDCGLYDEQDLRVDRFRHDGVSGSTGYMLIVY
jgi:hypothetical protein